MTKKEVLQKVAFLNGAMQSFGAAAKAPFKPGMKMLNFKSNINLAGSKLSNSVGLGGKFSKTLGYGAPAAVAGLAVGGAALGAKKLLGKKEENKNKTIVNNYR